MLKNLYNNSIKFKNVLENVRKISAIFKNLNNSWLGLAFSRKICSNLRISISVIVITC